MGNITSRRFEEMRETSQVIAREVRPLRMQVGSLGIHDESSEWENFVFRFLEEKIGKGEINEEGKKKKQPLRAYYARKTYEYIVSYGDKLYKSTELPKEKEQLFYEKLPFLFELIIIIQYLHNHILDEKMDISSKNDEKVHNALIAANIQRSLFTSYLKKAIRPLLKKKDTYFKIHDLLTELFLSVDIGQWVDKHHNNFKAWRSAGRIESTKQNHKLIDEVANGCILFIMGLTDRYSTDKRAFVEVYLKRIYLTNVYFFRCITEVISTLMGATGKEIIDLKCFSVYYGFMLQIINDYADFAFSSKEEEQKYRKNPTKKPEDVFADLYNFNVTIPLILHLRNGLHGKIGTYLTEGKKTRQFIDKYKDKVLWEIKESGAIRECIEISQRISDKAKTYLDPENTNTPYFEDMCDMAYTNKYLKIFYPKWGLCTKALEKIGLPKDSGQICCLAVELDGSNDKNKLFAFTNNIDAEKSILSTIDSYHDLYDVFSRLWTANSEKVWQEIALTQFFELVGKYARSLAESMEKWLLKKELFDLEDTRCYYFSYWPEKSEKSIFVVFASPANEDQEVILMKKLKKFSKYLVPIRKH